VSSTPTVSPSRFLFVLWDGGGNVPPQLGLAAGLAARGHRVRVLAEDSLAADVAAAGAEFEPFAAAPDRASREEDLVCDWQARTPLGAFARARDRVIMGPAAAYAADTYAALEREPADVLASDFMLFGPPIAGERAGVPTALIVHNVYIVPEPGKPAPGPGFLPARGRSDGRGTSSSAGRSWRSSTAACRRSTGRASSRGLRHCAASPSIWTTSIARWCWRANRLTFTATRIHRTCATSARASPIHRGWRTGSPSGRTTTLVRSSSSASAPPTWLRSMCWRG
jgi:UDP:flavonoid glycosyltransferase YjiC (YdhE family)